MLYKLICLLKEGVALSNEELADQPRHTGNLVMDMWEQGGSFKRPVRQARLLSTDFGAERDIIPPLFEPVLIKITATRMVIEGIEIKTSDKIVRYYRQTWLLRRPEAEALETGTTTTKMEGTPHEDPNTP